jgi:hypothetical protein
VHGGAQQGRSKRGNKPRRAAAIRRNSMWKHTFYTTYRRMREEAETVFGEHCRFERWPDIPIHVLAGKDDRFFPIEFQRLSRAKGSERRRKKFSAAISSRCRMRKD